MYADLSLAALAAVVISPALAFPMPWDRGNWRTSTLVVPGYSQSVVAPSVVGNDPHVTTSVTGDVPQPSTVPGGAGGGEQHVVTLVNNCPSGEAVLQVGTKVYTGTTTISGELVSGLAWVKGGTYGCGAENGHGCGDIEFTLKNSGQSSINYSLQANGNQVHAYKYPMHFTTSDCSLLPYVPSQCTGDDQVSCPGAFVGLATEGGTVFSCTNVPNMGLTITFC